SMHNAVSMRATQPLRRLDHEIYRLGNRNGALEAVFERSTINIFHHDKGDTVLLAKFMNWHDIGMLEFGNRASLLLEAFQEDGVAGMIGRQHFDSHVSIKVWLICLENSSHAA